MKNSTFLIISMILFTLPLAGQENKTIIVKAGTTVEDYFTPGEKYRYPEFIQGKVLFKDGTFTVTKMNYSILLGEMQFLQNRDTLAIANVNDVSCVQIMLDTFYYDNGYLEKLAGRNPAIMTVKQYVKLADIKKEGPYGTRSSTSATQTYGGVYDEGVNRNYKLVLQEDLVLSKNTDYYIGSNSNGFLPYKKSNVLKLFPKNKPEIENYLKTNAVNFKIRDDLMRLTDFLGKIK